MENIALFLKKSFLLSLMKQSSTSAGIVTTSETNLVGSSRILTDLHGYKETWNAILVTSYL